jgi:hypothetical protein
MIKFRYPKDKQKILSEERPEIDLDRLIFLMQSGKILVAIPSKSRPNQIIFVVDYGYHVASVPCAIEPEGYLIRTAWLDSKMRDKFKPEYKNKKEGEYNGI